MSLLLTNVKGWETEFIQMDIGTFLFVFVFWARSSHCLTDPVKNKKQNKRKLRLFACSLRNLNQLLRYRTSFGWNNIGFNARCQTRGHVWNYTHSLNPLFTLNARVYFVNISSMSVIFISSLDFIKLSFYRPTRFYKSAGRNNLWGWPGSTCFTSTCRS